MVVDKEVVKECSDELEDLIVQIAGPETMGITGTDVTMLLRAHSSEASMADTLTHEVVHNVYPSLKEEKEGGVAPASVESVVARLMRNSEWRRIVYRRLCKELYEYTKEMAESWEEKKKK